LFCDYVSLARLAVALKVGDGGASAKTAARVGEALITLGEPPGNFKIKNIVSLYERIDNNNAVMIV